MAGLVIGGHGTYVLTEVAKRYFFPIEDEERDRRLALFQMIRTPAVFNALISRFDGGKIPAKATLTNIVYRDMNVTQSWKERVATLFLSALVEAGAIDQGGFLRYKALLSSLSGGGAVGARDAGVKEVDARSGELDAPSSLSTSTPSVPRPSDQTVRDCFTTWNHRGIRVDVPENLTMELWKKLSDYIEVLKPDAVKTDPAAPGS